MLAEKTEFKITSKIEQLLVRIAENNYTSINEMNLFFTSNGHVYKVLRGLLDIGVLSSIPTKIMPSKVYHLTGIGYDYLERKGALRSIGRFQASDFRITTCFHHLTCLGVRILLEDILGATNWISEKRLNRSRTEEGIKGHRVVSRVTDAEFDLRGGHIGVEVELTLKSPDIFKKNIDALNDRIKDDDLHNVLWVTRAENVKESMKKLLGIDEKFKPHLNDVNASHLFVDYNDLFLKRGAALVMDLSNKVKELRDLK